MTFNYYTAVGSRETPVDIQIHMMRVAKRLRELEWVFRSGKAAGADAAFQVGAQTHLRADYDGTFGEVYKPWKSFQTAPDSRTFDNEDGHTLWDWWDIDASKLPNWKEAQEIASNIHPAWDKLKTGAKALHSRNVYQVLGKDLNTPSKFLVCYSKPSGQSVSGGTRTAYELARSYNIPCFNYATMSPLEIGEQIKLIIEGK